MKKVVIQNINLYFQIEPENCVLLGPQGTEMSSVCICFFYLLLRLSWFLLAHVISSRAAFSIFCFHYPVLYIVRLCGLLVSVPGCISRGPGFDPRLCQIFLVGVGLERGPLYFVSTIKELLGRNSTAPAQKTENTAVGIRCADHATPLSAKISINLADKWRSLDRYSSLAD
jgi:hypothetical protein